MDGFKPRLSLIFVLLAIGFILFISNITSLRNLYQLTATFYKTQSPIQYEIRWRLGINHTYCGQFGQKPTAEEAIEERHLLDSIAWPGPPVHGLPVEFSSDPGKSYFVIQGPEKQHVGEQLVVNVHVQNFLGLPKNHGGDFLIARLHSPELGAGVAGKVIDHHDGNYTLLFPLLWAGEVRVEITMVHPSEAVVVLKRLQEEHPDRGIFKSLFRSGALSETTECNLCLPLNQKPLCNYTDPETGEPWYCYKPKQLDCDTRVTHFRGGLKQNIITEYEVKFLQSGVNLKVPILAKGMGSVTVLPAEEDFSLKGQPQERSNHTGVGYYLKHSWIPLNNMAMHSFNDISAITHCIKGKMIYMFGDSTSRQWFEYLTAIVPNLKQINLNSPHKAGPYMAVDTKNNIMVNYRCHGPPLFYTTVYSSELRYVANELGRIEGGASTVILLSVAVHFNSFPVEVYIRRLRHIRRAVVQLLNREPATVVVIRTANLRKMNLQISLTNSDWFSMQQNAVLRAMFEGLNVQILDAWEMTLAHYLPHDIHPPRPIIKNMIDLILSCICWAGKT